MKLKLPKTIKDLRLYHLQAIAETDILTMDAYDKIVLVSKLTGVEVETLRRVSLQQVKGIIDHYLKLITDYKYKSVKLPNHITIEGVKYDFIKSIAKQPLSWHIDISYQDTKDSATVAAFCFIEHGLDYCTMDKNKNVVNPIAPRRQIFEEHLTADLYISLGFFLKKKLKSYNSAFMEIKRQRLKIQNKEKILNTKQVLT